MTRIASSLLKYILIIVAAWGCSTSSLYAQSTQVEVTTSKGKFTVVLYDDTPLHKAQFLQNVAEGRYENTLFHRVIALFMVQGGNFSTRGATKETDVSYDTLSITIPAEINEAAHFHKRGALAAARLADEANPERASSGSQFYVVTGRFFTDYDLDQIEEKKGRPFSEAQRKAYKEQGGAPWLDGQYTVFGEVVQGMKVIERIERASTDSQDRPKKDIIIKKIRVVTTP